MRRIKIDFALFIMLALVFFVGAIWATFGLAMGLLSFATVCGFYAIVYLLPA